MQLRAWLEEVIQANEALEARVDALEASAAAAMHEKAALEGWVRGSVAEQAAASTRLASFQVRHLRAASCGLYLSTLHTVRCSHAQRKVLCTAVFTAEQAHMCPGCLQGLAVQQHY